MKKVEQIKLEELMNKEIKPRTLLVIKSKPQLNAIDDGVELNEGYDFELDGAIPELADAIAKFAFEMSNNGFGPNSGSYFIQLIHEYYERLSSTDVK